MPGIYVILNPFAVESSNNSLYYVSSPKLESFELKDASINNTYVNLFNRIKNVQSGKKTKIGIQNFDIQFVK